jgi:Leucine-rich repeat (LRR) protein
VRGKEKLRRLFICPGILKERKPLSVTATKTTLITLTMNKMSGIDTLAPPVKLSSQQYNALHDLYNATNGRYWFWHNLTGSIPWDFSNANSDPCLNNWQGLRCTCSLKQCSIKEMSLSHHNLSGHLPQSIGNFPSLILMDLKGNNITREVPSTIGALTALESIDLSSNYFSGLVPSSMNQLTNLKVLNFNYNGFTSLPSNFFNFPQLQFLLLAFIRFAEQYRRTLGI